MRKRTLFWVTAAVLGAALHASPAAAGEPQASSNPVPCSQLAVDPAFGLAGNPVIKSATSAIVPPSGPNQSYCQVNVLYGASPEQNINIRVGLPLNSVDGGSGGLLGAWNGRTQGVGGGGCAGNLNVTAP